jgi:hypothetical protein
MARHPAIGKYMGVALAALGFIGAVGAEPDRPPMTVIFTPNFRVRVESASAPVGLVYSTWADPFLQRIYRLLQWESHPLPDRTLTIRQYPAEEGRVGELTAEQPVAGQVEQVLSVFGTAGMNRPVLDELLAEASLERQVIIRMTPEARQKGLPAVPRWMSVGMARYLDSELRVRDARWVGDSIEVGVWPGVAEWVTWQNLPQGYAEEKSFSCQAVAWILSRPSGAAGVNGLLNSLSLGRQIDARQVAACLNFSTVAEAEADWKSWLERQGRMVRFGVDMPRDLARRLRMQMVFTDEELARAGAPPDLELTAARLVDYRGKLWVRKLTARKADTLRLMAIGKDKEFCNLAAAAATYLEICGRSRFWPLSVALRRQYGELEQQFEHYEQAVIFREAYVDRIEAEGSGESAPEYEQGLEKSALRDYVDRVESNLTGGVFRPSQR